MSLELVAIICHGCGHLFNVALKPENYFFQCQLCRTVGNLPGVLLTELDRKPTKDDDPVRGLTEEERSKMESEIVTKFPHPAPPPPAVPQARRQSV